jgi:hypothetical protein
VVAGTPMAGTPSPQPEEHGKQLLGTCMVEIEKETSRCKDESDVNEKTNNGLTELVSTEGGGAGKLGTLVFKLRSVSNYYVTPLQPPDRNPLNGFGRAVLSEKWARPREFKRGRNAQFVGFLAFTAFGSMFFFHEPKKL